MRKRDKEHSFHYNAMRCDAMIHTYRIIIFCTALIACAQKTHCENEFDGQGPEVFALFSFEIFITFFRTIHTMVEDSITKYVQTAQERKNMKYMWMSRYIIGAKEEKHTLHLYNYISISIYSEHCTANTFGRAFGSMKKVFLEERNKIKTTENSWSCSRILAWEYHLTQFV